MNDNKCQFCSGTGIEPGEAGCAWCFSTGTKEGQKLLTPPDEATIPDSIELPAEQHQGEPVAVVDEGDDGLFVELIYGDNGNPLRRGDKLYTHPAPADPGEVERLREGISKHWKVVCDQRAQLDTLRAQLAEAHALLRDALDNGELGRDDVYEAIHDYLEGHEALSASAEPSAPKCETCMGNGVVGWTRGQTPEQFEQGEDECADCFGTGHAHSQGMAVPGTCTTCNGTGMVDDGEITCSEGGIPYENGPVKCVKECPDCTPSAPVERDERDERADFEREAIRIAVRSFGYRDGEALLKTVLERRGNGTYCVEWVNGAMEGWNARAALERKP